MVVEAVQNYVNMVNGLSKMTRERAFQTARVLLAQAGLEGVANDAEKRVGKLAEEILLASRANRELVENLVAGEVEKAAARWGFVRSDDVEALREEIAELRRSLVKATVANSTQSEAAVKKAAKKSPAAGRAARSPKTETVEKTPSQGPPLGGAADAAGTEPNLPDPPFGEPLVTDPGEPGATPLIQSPAEVAAQRPSPVEAKTLTASATKKAAAKRATANRTTANRTTAKKSLADRGPAEKSPAKKGPAAAGAPTEVVAQKTPTKKTPTKKTPTTPITTTQTPAKKISSKKSAPAQLPAPAAPLTSPLPETGSEGDQ